MTPVQTTAGPVASEDLGITLAHEHINVRAESVVAQFPHLYDREAAHRKAVAEVRAAMALGVQTIFEPSAMDLGTDVRASAAVARETGVNLVVATGVYGQHYTFLPHHFQMRDVDYLADAFVHDIEVGMQGTEIRAAFLKGAVDEPGITPDIDKVLRALAHASLRTERPIMVHSHPATGRGLEIMDVLDAEGIDPARVVIAHTGDTDDLDYIEALLARGPFIGMDRYGLDIILPTARRNATVTELCRRGYAGRMMLSQDASAGDFDWYPPELKAQMVPDWSLTFVFETVLGQLRELGVTDAELDAMLRDAPRAWLAGA